MFATRKVIVIPLAIWTFAALLCLAVGLSGFLGTNTASERHESILGSHFLMMMIGAPVTMLAVDAVTRMDSRDESVLSVQANLPQFIRDWLLLFAIGFTQWLAALLIGAWAARSVRVRRRNRQPERPST